jgi:hypothetical protein
MADEGLGFAHPMACSRLPGEPRSHRRICPSGLAWRFSIHAHSRSRREPTPLLCRDVATCPFRSRSFLILHRITRPPPFAEREAHRAPSRRLAMILFIRFPDATPKPVSRITILRPVSRPLRCQPLSIHKARHHCTHLSPFAAKHQDRSVKYPQHALHLHGKIHKPLCVDNVDGVSSGLSRAPSSFYQSRTEYLPLKLLCLIYVSAQNHLKPMKSQNLPESMCAGNPDIPLPSASPKSISFDTG